MRLYLVRHCDATHPAENPERPLSEHGNEQARRLARFLSGLDLAVDQVVHSGVLRAAQTAEVLAGAVQPPRGVRLEPGITPGDSARDAVDRLRFGDESRMVVTHLPIVAHMASILLTGSERGESLTFRTGTLAALDGEGDHWSLEWLVHPALLRS